MDELQRVQHFEQYKLFVELADRTSARRQSANAFFMQALTALAVAYPLVAGTSFAGQYWRYAVPVIALFLCASWWANPGRWRRWCLSSSRCCSSCSPCSARVLLGVEMAVRMGDKCFVRFSGVLKHYGVCVGHDARGEPLFVHNTQRHGRVTRATLAEFAGGVAVQIEASAPRGQEQVVAQRALALLGTPYDLLTFNCEHAANLASTGKASSGQVAVGVLGALFSLGAAVVANNNGTSVGADGYRRDAGGRFGKRLWW